jgi:hypothetical protein
MRIRRCFAGELGCHFDSVRSQDAGFAWIVRKQTNPFDAKLTQDRSRQAEVPIVSLEAQSMIGLDRIEAGVLQFVSFQLRHQPDAAALLILIDHEPATFVGDSLHRHFQLVVAITAQRPEYFAGEALRMDPQQRSSFDQIAHDNRERGFDP